MIQIVKLITGEELIGDINQIHDMCVIKQPCVLQMVLSRTDSTQPMLSLVPYAYYTEEHEIEISNNNVIWVAKPVKEVYNQYNKIFGSGIQLAGL